MIVSALGLVSPLSQDPAASKQLTDILPLLLGKYKCIRFYSPWGELPKHQAWDSCSWLTRSEGNQGPIGGSTQERLRGTRRWDTHSGNKPFSNSHQPYNIATIQF